MNAGFLHQGIFRDLLQNLWSGSVQTWLVLYIQTQDSQDINMAYVATSHQLRLKNDRNLRGHRGGMNEMMFLEINTFHPNTAHDHLPCIDPHRLDKRWHMSHVRFLWHNDPTFTNINHIEVGSKQNYLGLPVAWFLSWMNFVIFVHLEYLQCVKRYRRCLKKWSFQNDVSNIVQWFRKSFHFTFPIKIMNVG